MAQTFVSIVTYGEERAQWCRRLVDVCLQEPDVQVWVTDNGGLGSALRGLAGRVNLLAPGENLGAGGGRNLQLRHRLPGTPFIRLDDDWLPKRPGWVRRLLNAQRRSRATVVRLAPELPLGKMKMRLPDASGNYLVSGECADALGGFFQGFGKTLLDDLEYTRRAWAWSKRQRPQHGGVWDLGEPLTDLCWESGGGPRGWLAPWELFEAHCRKLAAKGSDLLVPYDPARKPGWLQRDAGLSDCEIDEALAETRLERENA